MNKKRKGEEEKMRKLKKLAAVALAATMTMAMGVSAFADQVTIHFNNPKGWDAVGGWIASMDWSVKYTQTASEVLKDAEGNAIWPGAKATAEGNGWYSVTVEVEDKSKGLIAIFNNYVGDKNGDNIDCATSGDICAAAGVAVNGENGATKEQSDNLVITASKFTGNEYWAEWDGTATGQPVKMKAEAPASYATQTETTTAAAETTTAAAAASGETQTTAAGATQTTAAGATQTTKAATTAAPKTGDTVAVSAVVLAIAAAAVVVVSKKRENA